MAGRHHVFSRSNRRSKAAKEWACARRSNLNNSLTTKIDPYRFFNHVCSRATRGAWPCGGWGHAARRATLHRVQVICTCARSELHAQATLATVVSVELSAVAATNTSSEGFSQSRCGDPVARLEPLAVAPFRDVIRRSVGRFRSRTLQASTTAARWRPVLKGAGV
jgi:hypothetical protein